MERSKGGHSLAQAPVQVAFPAWSAVKRYKVRPELVARTVPILGTLTVLMSMVCADDEPPAEAGAARAAPIVATRAPPARSIAPLLAPSRLKLPIAQLPFVSSITSHTVRRVVEIAEHRPRVTSTPAPACAVAWSDLP